MSDASTSSASRSVIVWRRVCVYEGTAGTCSWRRNAAAMVRLDHQAVPAIDLSFTRHELRLHRRRSRSSAARRFPHTLPSFPDTCRTAFRSFPILAPAVGNPLHPAAMDRPGYDNDLVLWAEGQARALRVAAATASNLDIDWANLAEEIEALARSERSALANNVATVIEHLAKLQASPAIGPRIGWQETILRARATIQELLEASPGMQSSVDDVVRVAQPRAIRLAGRVMALHGETPRIPLEQVSYTADQVLSDWWPPEA